MNRTLKFAIGVVLGIGLVTPAIAQTNFPDIPDNHWAYEALANLKGKILYGYPDGLYRPARPMSRAEFAAAINQLYMMMMAKHNSLDSAIASLQSQIDALKNRPSGGGDVSSADFNALKRQVSDLQSKVDSMSSWGNDIAQMKRLAGEFEKELAGLGVDMDAMKKDLSDLDMRVKNLENRKGNIEIHGDGNVVVLAGHSTDGEFGMSPGGRIFGFGHDGTSYEGAHVGMTRDLSVFHEFNTTLSGKAGDNVKWKASMNFNNMLGSETNGLGSSSAFGDGAELSQGNGFDSNNEASMYLDEMNATIDTSVAGQGFTATVGRYRHKSGMFFLQRQDTTEFYSNSRWDDGAYIMDGAMLDFGFGGADLTAFYGRAGTSVTATGFSSLGLNAMVHDLGNGSFEAMDTLGTELKVKLGDIGSVRGVYLWQDSQNIDAGINRQNTFGGEVNVHFGDIKVYGTFAQTNFSMNTSNVLSDDNTAVAAWASYDGGNWGVDGGYARVEGNFGAFGSWGRLGTAWNPANVEGFGGGAWFKASNNLKLMGSVASFDGASDNAGLFGIPIMKNESINSYRVGLNYGLNSAWDMDLGYEVANWDLTGANPEQQWYTIGLNYNASDSTMVKFTYMFSDIDYKGQGGRSFFNGLEIDPFGANRYKGGMFGTQVSFKF
ncbi:MAG TPA: S-layer homology domain-containing protein [Fimbriimonadaceae bacterium]|nr:S-layer homology domain-containing protein [Fimbriimonadaceae bacterium]